MIITILSATQSNGVSKTGKGYPFIDLAYKGSDGKVTGKKIMPFGESKPVYDALVSAKSGEFYDITAIKNEGTGYWDWTNAKQSTGMDNAAVPTTRPTTGGKVVGSNYETPEERAKRQVYIVRQSSITAALSFLNNKSKSTDEVIQIAKEFEKYVFDIGQPAAAIKTTSIHDLDNDIV